MRIDLDIHVLCNDGAAVELKDVVIDPATLRLTHLVVASSAAADSVRLIPSDVALPVDSPPGVSLALSSSELAAAQTVQESCYVRMGEQPPVEDGWGLGIHDYYPQPAYGGLGPEIMGGGANIEYDDHEVISYHRIPRGHVEIRRASSVNSADGHHVGHVIGFVIGDRQQIDSLVLEHGHLWGKRSVQIPCKAIDRFENDELALTISADAVGALEPLPKDHHR